RPEFWWWILFTTIVSAVLNALPVWPFAWTSGMHLANGTTVPVAVPGSGGLGAAWSIAVLLPTLGLAVRRLRDAGYGWGHLFWLLLPIAGLIVVIVLLAQPSLRQPLSAPPQEPAPAATTGTPPGSVP
ncbi:MAG: DUF805 domain-containing protein, partial [Amnibacterium sp.]